MGIGEIFASAVQDEEGDLFENVWVVARKN
jgi:hypothetical protein